MATVPNTPQNLLIGNVIYTWSSLASGDDGAPVGFTGSGDRTVQVLGTPGAGGTVLIEGSLDGVNYSTLRDPSGVALSFTGPGLKAILENVVSLRPRVTGGDGSTSFTVLIAARRGQNG